MGKIINFQDNNDTELTEYEKQILIQAQEEGPVTGKHLDIANAKINQEELRIRNGLEPKNDMLDLIADSLRAAAMDGEEEDI